MKLILLVLTALVSSCYGQEAAADSLTIVPIECATLEEVDTDLMAKRLESGELDPSADAASLDVSIISPVPRCENGPRRIIHTVPNEFHWPPIYRGSCDRLFCQTPPCLVRKSRTERRCVHVFKLVNWKWEYDGRQERVFVNHLECGCKRCEDIFNQRQCVSTRPCPNSYRRDSFCYWTPFIFTIKPPTPVLAEAQAQPVEDAVIAPVPLPLPIHGRCRCCNPVVCEKPQIFVRERCRCECPPTKPCTGGQIFNKKTCKCECPKGSKLNSQGECEGDCKDVSSSFCGNVKCTDNPLFKCKRVDTKCVCPSCEDANAHQCFRTNCLEQKTKPMCKYDYYAQKCRCPRCEDQIDQLWCEKTLCGPNYHLQCKWNSYYRTCSCPH